MSDEQKNGLTRGTYLKLAALIVGLITALHTLIGLPLIAYQSEQVVNEILERHENRVHPGAVSIERHVHDFNSIAEDVREIKADIRSIREIITK